MVVELETVKEGLKIKSGPCFPQRILNIVNKLLGVDPDYLVTHNKRNWEIGYVLQEDVIELSYRSSYSNTVEFRTLCKIPVFSFRWDYDLGKNPPRSKHKHYQTEVRNFLFKPFNKTCLLNMNAYDTNAFYDVSLAWLPKDIEHLSLQDLDEYCGRVELDERLKFEVSHSSNGPEIKFKKVNIDIKDKENKDNKFLTDILREVLVLKV